VELQSAFHQVVVDIIQLMMTLMQLSADTECCQLMSSVPVGCSCREFYILCGQPQHSIVPVTCSTEQ